MWLLVLPFTDYHRLCVGCDLNVVSLLLAGAISFSGSVDVTLLGSVEVTVGFTTQFSTENNSFIITIIRTSHKTLKQYPLL